MKRISFLMLLFAGSMLIFTACKNEKPAGATEQQEAETSEAEASSMKASDMPGETFTINPESAKMSWHATKVGGEHNGTVDIKDGFLKMDDGKLTGGAFTIDMTSITVLDQKGEWKEKLERHLKGFDQGKEDHFFNVNKFPTAQFVITKVTELEGSEYGNIMVYGDLTIKGTTKPVGMTAVYTADGNFVKVGVEELILDRTNWGVNYNSKKIFADLQDNIIHDDFKLQFSFSAEKA